MNLIEIQLLTSNKSYYNQSKTRFNTKAVRDYLN